MLRHVTVAAAAATCCAGYVPRGAAMRAAVRADGTSACTMPAMRPPPAQRTFASSAIDSLITSTVGKFKDPNLATLWANTLPNALDTTVYSHTPSNQTSATGQQGPDTFIITGDILAMWLRDSTNQVWPYVPYAHTDAGLQDFLRGLIQRQARSVLIDPYANAYQVDARSGQGPHTDDSTYTTLFAGTVVSAMTPAIFERKWEVDSLANVLRLSARYYSLTGDVSPFNATWVAAVSTILSTYAAQQLDTAMEDAGGGPSYFFQRQASQPTDTLQSGRGFPVKYTGMIKSAFRGSDDACIYSYNIPENAFAYVALSEAAPLLDALGQSALAQTARGIAAQVLAGINAHGIIDHPTAGRVYAYEVDGFGNWVFMDDANIPGLLSMPYYGFTAVNDSLYQATRAAVLSPANPWFLNGSAASGVGGPHIGWPNVWPMSIIMQGWSASSDSEVAAVLATLEASSACTGLMHESFDKDNFASFTRPWFAWVNSLFGDFVLKVAAEHPSIIFS